MSYIPNDNFDNEIQSQLEFTIYVNDFETHSQLGIGYGRIGKSWAVG